MAFLAHGTALRSRRVFPWLAVTLCLILVSAAGRWVALGQWWPVAITLIVLAGVQILRIRPFPVLCAWFLLQPLIERVPGLDLPGIPNLAPMRLLFASLLASVASRLLSRRVHLAKPRSVDLVWLLFAAYWCAHSVLSPAALRSIMTFTFAYAIPFVLFYLTRSLVDSQEKLLRLLDTCMWAALALGLGAVYEQVTYRPVLSVGWARPLEILAGKPRSQSFLGGAWVLSMTLSMLIPLCVYMLAQKTFTRRRRRFFGVVLLTATLGLAFAFIRAGWIAVVAGLLVQAVVWRGANRRRLALVMLAVIGIAAVIVLRSPIFERKILDPRNVMGRIDMTASQLQIWRRFPLLGQGVGTMYGEIVGLQGLEITGSHSTYLNILASIGAIGLIFYLLPQALCVIWGVRRTGMAADGDTDVGLVATALAMVAAYGVNALAIETAGFSYVNGLLWLALALLLIPHPMASLNNSRLSQSSRGGRGDILIESRSCRVTSNACGKYGKDPGSGQKGWKSI